MIASNPDRPQINPRKLVRDGRERELFELICATGYIPEENNFSDFCESLKAGKALLACGEPGGGKTVFCDALAESCNLDHFTVAGRAGLQEEDLLCSWDKTEQDYFMQQGREIVRGMPLEAQAAALENVRASRWTRQFLILGEVAAAYAKAAETKFPTLLRLDEVDKFSFDIQDALLTPLASGIIYVERLDGFIGCADDADSQPIVVSTSNDLRNELSEPFRDRHLHSWFAVPSLEKELEILAARCPEASSSDLSNAMKLLDAIRSVAGVSHRPSVRTSIELIRAFERNRQGALDERNVTRYFTYFAKNRSDAKYLTQQLPYLISCVRAFHPAIDGWLAERDAAWAKRWKQNQSFYSQFQERVFV